MDKSQMKYVEGGYCDERGAAFCGNAAMLPNGTWGMVLLAVNGGELTIRDVDAKSQPGRVLYRIPLSQTEGLRFKGFIIKTLVFKYNGFEYSFGSLIATKSMREAFDVILEESKK